MTRNKAGGFAVMTLAFLGDAAYVQWKRIKDQYDKKKREAAKKKSGSAADDYLKKWAWSAHMSFLDKVRIVAQP